MDVHLEDLSERDRFEVKLQISLYHTAEKVIVEERKEDFEKYMEDRKERIRKIIGVKSARIYENGKLLLEV